jgi:hypothetical protein
MALYVNNEGKVVLESKAMQDFDGWLNVRKSIIESLQAQNPDYDCENNYYLLELLQDLEPTREQAKKIFQESPNTK